MGSAYGVGVAGQAAAGVVTAVSYTHLRNPLSKKVVEIEPSGIRKFFDVVNEMEDAISLGVGEPDFDTPWSCLLYTSRCV